MFMKRVILLLIVVIFGAVYSPANAGFWSDKKAEIKTNHQIRADKKAIKRLLLIQNKYADAFDGVSLSSLYSDDFKSSDGFDKEVYFKLIDETWKSYPDITYKTDIKDINVKGDSASVDVYETSLATTMNLEQGVPIYGELHAYSNGTYFLKKINDKWYISAETVKNEKSVLKYGDFRYFDVDLISPETAKAGEYYTAKLTVNVPSDAVIVASIGRDDISYPQKTPEEVFRKMSDDNTLERMFLANKDGKNEYNVASVAMTRPQVADGKMNLYMAGVAFVMARVNVEGINEK